MLANNRGEKDQHSLDSIKLLFEPVLLIYRIGCHVCEES
jgi:hypothetical protein